MDECSHGVSIQLLARALHGMASACLFLCLSIDPGRNVGRYLYVLHQATKMRERHRCSEVLMVPLQTAIRSDAKDSHCVGTVIPVVQWRADSVIEAWTLLPVPEKAPLESRQQVLESCGP